MHLSSDIIRQKLSQPLPGLSSHLKLAPPERAKEIAGYLANRQNAKQSAVMILLFNENNRTKVILIRRSFYVGIHAGQIAFPGGRYEETDPSIEHTALREIEEEIGIGADKIEVLGRLSDIYVPPSNFLISVFVGFLNEKRHQYAGAVFRETDVRPRAYYLRRLCRLPPTSNAAHSITAINPPTPFQP